MEYKNPLGWLGLLGLLGFVGLYNPKWYYAFALFLMFLLVFMPES